MRASVDQVELWKDKLEVLRRARPIRLLQTATNPGLLNQHDQQYHVSAVPTSHLSILEQLSIYGELETPAKSQVALDLLADLASSGKKTVVWSNFLGNLDHFAHLVRDRLGLPVFQVDGRVPAGEDSLHAIVEEKDEGVETRESVIARFLEAQDVGVLIANPASCSESISLHRSCKNAIYLDRTYDAALWLHRRSEFEWTHRGQGEREVRFYMSANEYSVMHKNSDRYVVHFWGGINLERSRRKEYEDLTSSGYPIVIDDLPSRLNDGTFVSTPSDYVITESHPALAAD
jgi:hypothetical protein